MKDTSEKLRIARRRWRSLLSLGLDYFAYSGFLIVLVVAGYVAFSARSGSLAPEWLLIGIFSPLYLFGGSLEDRLARRLATSRLWWTFVRRAPRRDTADTLSLILKAVLAVLYLVATLALLFDAHRRYAAILGLLQLAFVYNLQQKSVRSYRWAFAVGFAGLTIWGLSLGFSYVPVNAWLLNATPSSAIALPAFGVSFAVILSEFGSVKLRLLIPRTLARTAQYAVAFACFAELALRTDNFFASWVPYHQSYFVGPATLVRQGHWLLWDVPSQYGFLSVLAIAVTPGASAWQSIYFLTAIVLLIQAAMMFVLFRYGRTGWLNYAAAFAICCATFFSSQAARWPFGARLYPQEGLRFIWPLAMLFIIFMIHVRRGDPKRSTYLRLIGHALWSVGILWSFETGIWTTIVWVTYLITDAAVQHLKFGAISSLGQLLVNRFVPLIVFASAGFLTVDTYYRVHLGHGADWVSFIEFNAAYANAATVQVPVNLFGGGWAILPLLGAVGALIWSAIRVRRFDLLPILIASWTTVWSTSLYYVGEPFDQHVNMLTAFFAYVAGIVLFVTDRSLRTGLIPLLARLSFVPMFVMMVATAFGEPSHIAKIRMPLTPGYHFDVTSEVPLISGELLALEKRAGIGPGDRVILPNGVLWVTIDNGMIMPFVQTPGGVAEQTPWLPRGPAGLDNAFFTLPMDRRGIYVRRYLEIGGPTGWYITYHEAADCTLLEPRMLRTERVLTSRNFSAALCRRQRL